MDTRRPDPNRIHTYIFRFVVKTKFDENGIYTVKSAQGIRSAKAQSSQSVIAHHKVEVRGTLSINAEGIDFEPDESIFP